MQCSGIQSPIFCVPVRSSEAGDLSRIYSDDAAGFTEKSEAEVPPGCNTGARRPAGLDEQAGIGEKISGRRCPPPGEDERGRRVAFTPWAERSCADLRHGA